MKEYFLHSSSVGPFRDLRRGTGKRIAAHLLSLPRPLRLVFLCASAVFIVTTFAIAVDWSGRFLVEVPRRGGGITEGIIGRPRFINPVIAKSDADRDLAALVYSGLLRPAPDGSFIPDLAESYDISDDGLTYTFALRDKLYWHDGEPVTSADVAFTIEKVRDPSLAIKSPRRTAWEGVEVATPDERTVVFRIKQPYAPLLENATLGIIPKHIWKNVPNEEFDVAYYNIEPIGSGPYRVTHVERDKEKGIPRWYDFAAFRHFALGEPYVEKIRIRFFGNNKELAQAFADGTIDQMPAVEPAVAKAIEERGAALLEAPLPRVFAAYFNQNQQPIFADPSVRRALAAAIDRDRIVADVLLGYGDAVTGPFPFDVTSPKNATSTAEEVLADARTLLEKAGWTVNASGVYEKTDKKRKTVQLLEFSMAVPDIQELRATAERMKEDWERLGASVALKVFEPSTFAAEVLAARKYDILFYGQIYTRIPDPYPYWHSSQRNAPGLNLAMYVNKTADKLIEDARRASDPLKRETLLGNIAAEVTADAPAIFVYRPNFLYARSPSVRGMKMGYLTTESERFMGVFEWYIESERVWKLFVD